MRRQLLFPTVLLVSLAQDGLDHKLADAKALLTKPGQFRANGRQEASLFGFKAAGQTAEW